MKVLLLNGPPRSGKDTIGRTLWDLIPRLVNLKFAEPIVQFMFQAYSIRMEQTEKDQPHPALNGRTPREVAIAYSERFCKPLYGQDYFGKLAARSIDQMEKIAMQVCCFTDSGFVHEARPVALHVGGHNVLQIRVTRPGRTFQGDSRSYWELRDPTISSIEFDNDGPDLTSLHTKVRSDLLPEIQKWMAL